MSLDTFVMIAFYVSVVMLAARVLGLASYHIAWAAVPYLTALTVQVTIQLIAAIEREEHGKNAD